MALSSSFQRLQPPPPPRRGSTPGALEGSTGLIAHPSIGSWVTSGSLLLLLLLIWWALTATQVLPPYAVASPASVIHEMRTSWHTLLAQTATTVEQLLIALAAVWILGALCGIAIGAIPRLWPLLGILRTSYAVPIVVIYPLLSIWFGIGSTSKIAFSFITGFLPMILMTSAAVRSIDETLFQLFGSIGARGGTLLRLGIVPAAFPGIVAAMRLSGSLSLAGVIVAEILLSTSGLGYMINSSAAQFETSSLYAGIVAVVVLAVAINWFTGTVQRRVGRHWGTWGGSA